MIYQQSQNFLNIVSKNKSYLNYFELNRILSKSKNIDYISLPYVQCSQQILRQVDKQYVSFYKAIKSNKMKGKHIRLSKYKDKEKGRNIVIYTNQCFKQKEDKIILKINKSTKIEFKTDKTNIQQVRIIPKGNHINIEIIYNKDLVYGNVPDRDSFGNHNNRSVIISCVSQADVKENTAYFTFCDINYSLQAVAGTFSDNFELAPKDGKITVKINGKLK